MNVKYKDKNESKNSLSIRQVHILNGCLLGKATIHTTGKYFSVNPIKRSYAEWLQEELDDQGAKYVKFTKDWEMKILKPPWLDTWRDRWYFKNKKIIPPNMSLTPLMAGIWFHDKGELLSHDRLTFSLNSMELSLKNGIDLLERAGFEAHPAMGDIEVSGKAREEFLKWMDLPDV